MPQIQRIGNQAYADGNLPLEEFFQPVFKLIEINECGGGQTRNDGGRPREIGGFFRIGKQAGKQYAYGK